jgi:O-antigen/teichoic acid export membrane protein
MNAYYLLSVIGNRLLALLTVLALSHLLSPNDFGVFTLVLTNAVLIHLLFSSWVSYGSWRNVSVGNDADQKDAISTSLGYASILATISLSIGLVLLLIDYDRFYNVAITFILTASVLIYELIMVIKNAQGLSKEHSAAGILRSASTFSFSVLLTFLGFGVRGAVVGQIVGTVLTILCQRSIWTMWRRIELSHIFRSGIAAQVRIGLISAFALNLYLMGNAVCRNIVLLGLGEAEAGYFSLAADMFYAPVAIFAMTASLSSVPELYRLAGSDKVTSHASDFLGGVLAVSIPYGLSGLFLGADVAHLLLGSNLSAPISQIAPHSVIHAACFCVLSVVTMIALTQGRLKIAVGLPIVTLAVLAGVMLATTFLLGQGETSLLRYAEAVTAALLLITGGILFTSRAVLRVPIPWVECLRVVGASLAMCLVLAALARFPLPFAPIPAIALGGATFVAAALLLRSRIVRNLLRLSAA